MVSSISGLFIQSNNCVLMSTEVIEEYATQYQDCLKSQDASHSQRSGRVYCSIVPSVWT
jgi:hypothetical protein